MPALKEAVDKGITVRILTRRYLGITELAALYLLKREFTEVSNFQLRSSILSPQSILFGYARRS